MATKTKRQRKRDRKRTYAQRLRLVRRMLNDTYTAAAALEAELNEWNGEEDTVYLTKRDAADIRGDLNEIKDFIRGAEDEL